MCLTLMLKAARHVHDAAWPRTKKGVYSLYRQPGIEQEGKRTVSLASLPDLPRLGRERRTHLALRQGKWSTPRTESDAKPEQHTIKASGGSSTAGRRPTHPGAYRAA